MSISIEDRKKVIVHTFQNGYFGHVIIEKALWSDLEEYISNYAASIRSDSYLADEMVKLRGFIWDSVKAHELNEYPVSEKHRERVEHWLNSVLGLNDSSPTAFCENGPRISEEEYIFKTFERSLGEYVTLLEENKSILGHGTTGLTSWQGALMLTDWFVMNGHILKGKRIMELGSGVGLLGIHLLKTQSDIREYTFTDTNINVLNFLNYNIILNLTPKDEKKDKYRDLIAYKEMMRTGPPKVVNKSNHNSVIAYYRMLKDGSTGDASVSLRKLDWTEGLPKFNLRDFDVILGSDIVYERSLILPLVKILKTSMDQDPRRRAYIACTERSSTTLELFEATISKEGLLFGILYKGMYSPRENILSSDVQHQRTRIYEIQKPHSGPTDGDCLLQTRTL